MSNKLPMWKNRKLSCKYTDFQFLLKKHPFPPLTLVGQLHSAPRCQGHRLPDHHCLPGPHRHGASGTQSAVRAWAPVPVLVPSTVTSGNCLT